MPISTKIEPISLDVEKIISDDLSPEAQSAALAEFAHDQIDEVRMLNAQVFGHVPEYDVIVDSNRGAPLESVKPSGVIVAEFDLLLELFTWIGQQLVANSPVRSGLYSRSHVFFADGVEVEPSGAVPEASEYVFINAQPYARKIDRGLSNQAPDGVYEAIAAAAHRRFSNVARIYFGYRDAGFRTVKKMRVNDNKGTTERRDRSDSSGRNPAIIIKLGR